MPVSATLVAFALLAVPQEPVEGAVTPSAARVLDALVERANALPGFHAVYRMTRPGEEDGRIDLFYAAPDRMRLDMGGAESSKAMRLWSVDKVMCLLGDGPKGAMWASFDYRRLESSQPEALVTLRQLFPDDTPTLEAGPTVEASWMLRTSRVQRSSATEISALSCAETLASR